MLLIGGYIVFVRLHAPHVSSKILMKLCLPIVVFMHTNFINQSLLNAEIFSTFAVFVVIINVTNPCYDIFNVY